MLLVVDDATEKNLAARLAIEKTKFFLSGGGLTYYSVFMISSMEQGYLSGNMKGLHSCRLLTGSGAVLAEGGFQLHANIKAGQDILNILDQNGALIKAFGVKRLGLFGSYIRGEQHPGSDVDLLVEFEPEKKTFDAFIELSFFLESILDRRVELVTIESLSPYIGPHILSEVEYAALAA